MPGAPGGTCGRGLVAGDVDGSFVVFVAEGVEIGVDDLGDIEPEGGGRRRPCRSRGSRCGSAKGAPGPSRRG